MQDRLRQILEEQLPYIGQGYGTRQGARTRQREIEEEFGGRGPSKASKVAAKRNPWILFLKYLRDHCNIPYNEAMVDPYIREVYEKNYGAYGSGALVGGEDDDMMGGVATCWTKFRHAKAGNSYLQKGKKAAMDRAYAQYKKTNCKVGAKRRVATKRRVVAKRKTAKRKVAPSRYSSQAAARKALLKCIGRGM